MTSFQKIIKYSAMAFAVFLAVNIIGGLLHIVGIFGGFFGGNAAVGEIKTYDVSSDIRRLEVNITAADFVITQGDRFLVESNLESLSVEEKNGVLSVDETKTKRFGSDYNGAFLTLYVPQKTAFEVASIKTGAGKLTVGQLSCGTVKLELGAGEAAIESLVAASEAAIEGGAGKITVADGVLHNLDLDMGVGQLDFTAALTGDCSFDLGVGKSDITVIGNRENYRLHVEKGIGSITVDGEDVSDFIEQTNNDNNIEINGGIGTICLKFKDS